MQIRTLRVGEVVYEVGKMIEVDILFGVVFSQLLFVFLLWGIFRIKDPYSVDSILEELRVDGVFLINGRDYFEVFVAWSGVENSTEKRFHEVSYEVVIFMWLVAQSHIHPVDTLRGDKEDE